MKALAIRQWLAPERDPQRVLGLRSGQAVTLGEVRRDAARVSGWLLQRTGVQTVRLAAEDAAQMVSLLVGTLAAGKTPVFSSAPYPADAELSAVPECSTPGPLAVPDAAEILLCTSGSSGTPKAVRRSVQAMDSEAGMVAQRWGSELAGSVAAGTVDLTHLFGLTFRLWVPMALGLPLVCRRIHYPEDCAGLPAQFFLVTTPTFLAYSDPAIPVPEGRFLLSAGGVLPPAAEKAAQVWLHLPVHEIYGSTESGALASRSATHEDWRPLDGVCLKAVGDEVFAFSPVLPSAVALDDRIALKPDGTFALRGRRDRIAKIGEQRISLTQVERAVSDVAGCPCRAAVVPSGSTQRLGVVLERPPAGPRQIAAWRHALAGRLEPLAVPRLWRFAESLPRNHQGKITQEAIREMFNA